MKILFFAVLFTLYTHGANPDPSSWSKLTSGRYEIKVSGLLCQTCSKVIAEETAKLKEVDKVSTDFDSDTLWLTVRPGQTLAIAKVRRALSRAAQRVNLGRPYTIMAVRYRVDAF